MRESQVQAEVKEVLAKLGFAITDTSQGYRHGGRRHATTRITKGTPDLYLQHPRFGTAWLEVKGEKTPITPEQVMWHAREREAGGRIAIVRSGADALWALKAWGIPVIPVGRPSAEMVEQFPQLADAA